MTNLIYITGATFSNFQKKGDGLNSQNINLNDKMLNDYFSFRGFYEVKSLSDEGIHLMRMGNGFFPNPNIVYDSLTLVLPRHKSELGAFSLGGVSRVQGKIDDRNIDGLITKSDSEGKYEIHGN
jgi:hypothetical protein